MTEQNIKPEGLATTGDTLPQPAAKKKASWFRTILWVLAMMLLVNVVMAIIAYWYFTYVAH